MEDSSGTTASAGSADSTGVDISPGGEVDTSPFRYCGEYVDLETGQIYVDTVGRNKKVVVEYQENQLEKMMRQIK